MKNASRKLSYILRHNPGTLEMDSEGWVTVGQVLNVLDITLKELQEIGRASCRERV